MGLTVKGSHCMLPGSLISTKTMCSLFLTVWSEICLWYCCSHFDCFLCKKTYCSLQSKDEDQVFLGCCLPGTPWHQIMHTRAPPSNCPITLSLNWRDKRGMLMLAAYTNSTKLQDPCTQKCCQWGANQVPVIHLWLVHTWQHSKQE